MSKYPQNAQLQFQQENSIILEQQYENINIIIIFNDNMKIKGANQAEKQTVTNCELLPYKFIKKNNSGKKLTKPLSNPFQWLEKYIGEQPYEPIQNQYDSIALLLREKNSNLTKSIHAQQNKQRPNFSRGKHSQFSKKSLDLKMKNNELNVDAKKASINLIRMKDFSSDNCSLIFEERRYISKRRHFRNKSTQICQNAYNETINNPKQDKLSNINYIPEDKIRFQFRRTYSKQNQRSEIISRKKSSDKSKQLADEKQDQIQTTRMIARRDKSVRIDTKYSQNDDYIKQFNQVFNNSFQKGLEQLQSQNTKNFLKSVKHLRLKRGAVNNSIKTSKNVFERFEKSIEEQANTENQPNLGNVGIISDFNLRNTKSDNRMIVAKHIYEQKLDFQLRKQQKQSTLILISDNETLQSIRHQGIQLRQLEDKLKPRQESQSNNRKPYYCVQKYGEKKYNKRIVDKKTKAGRDEQIAIQPWEPIEQIDQSFAIYNEFPMQTVTHPEIDATMQKKPMKIQPRISSKLLR